MRKEGRMRGREGGGGVPKKEGSREAWQGRKDGRNGTEGKKMKERKERKGKECVREGRKEGR
jgi:hypothetical protein